MEEAIHRFVRLLRRAGVRVGVSEAVDAMRALTATGIAADRELTRDALKVSLIKDRRDERTFDRIFDLFFRLQPVEEAAPEGHGHAHDDLSDQGELDQFSLSENPEDTPQQGHSHGKPVDIRKYFSEEDLAAQYNLHQEANRLDMASLTDEIVLSNDAAGDPSAAARVQLTTSRLHNPGRPGDLASHEGLKVDAELSVAQEQALLSWLGDDDPGDDDDGAGLDTEELAALRSRLSGLLGGLPEALRRHLETLMAGGLDVESPDVGAGAVDKVNERDRADLEEAVRRLLRSLHGAPRPRRTVAARGTVNGARTMRANMRYDGVPFRPITVARVADRPRLLLLVDVSLSVRTAARFTLQLVHGLQSMATKVRSFAFVSDLTEITDLFNEHPMEDALGLVMAGLPAGGVLDVDADSDYGMAFGDFIEEYGGAVNRHTTVIVLGDGRGNGNDPNFGAIAEIARRARELVWLTPEPRYSWSLGSCDLPGYATYCDRVHVVRDLSGLDRVTGLATARTAAQ
ncbi:MAG TPA: VWA domain-containing protein [Streptosporangiaceae bacterium]|nr:VWA domain-containing protein [Streptosporangiaceae bacterium]